MASIPPIPPLLCNTPPPIDFGEEEESSFSRATLILDGDDEFCEFALGSGTLNSAMGDDVSSLPPSPQPTASSSSTRCDDTNGPPALGPHDNAPGGGYLPVTENAEENTLEIRPVEARNLHVSSSCPTIKDENNCELADDKLNSTLPSKKVKNPMMAPPSTPPPISLTLAEANNVKELDNSANRSDSLKFNATSISSVNEHVLLEDLVDDSSDDERHSYTIKKDLSQIVDENADDFFTIYAADGWECNEMPLKHPVIPHIENISKVECVADDDTSSTSVTDTKSVSFIASDNFGEFANFNADFDKFADFTIQSVRNEVGANTLPTRTDVGTANDDNDDFHEFQDWTAGSDPTITPSFKPDDVQQTKMEENTISEVVATAHIECNEEQEDDGFGDFAEAAFLEVTASDSYTSNTTTQTVAKMFTQVCPNSAHSDNISERFKPILEIMFPSRLNVTSQEEGITKLSHTNVLQLASVDMAKALEYQWMNSEMRHALIRSLGIDSRNILFGEKWNSSMPRFAANLSFDPLKPLKTHSTNNITSPTEESDRSGAKTESDVNILKHDVPAVEFDWQSSGLVNPLDGSKEAKNTRGTETIYASELGEFHSFNSQQQSHTSNASSDDQFPETLNTSNELTVDVSTKSVEGVGEISKAIQANTTLHLSEENNDKLNSDNAMTSVVVEDNVSETVATSTYAGPLKETHIYTPPKDGTVLVKTKSAPGPKDFDYEIAAAGIVIDETVVKKEYRDVEYNPGFRLEFKNKFEEDSKELTTSIGELSVECAEDFTEFQSVPPPLPDCTHHESSGPYRMPSPVKTSSLNLHHTPHVAIPPAVTKTIEMNTHTRSRTSSPTIIENMILSPAILLPQAIALDNATSSKRSPKIEWGDTTTSINPEELARIEELFPQPKVPTTVKQKETSNSQNSTPTHMTSEQKATPQQLNFLSISASVAKQEKDAIQDDDYWSDFVSVPVKAVSKRPDPIRNNNNSHIVQTLQCKATILNANSIQTSYRQVNQRKHNDNATVLSDHKSTSSLRVSIENEQTTNDEEWSEFVSSTPSLAPTSLTAGATAVAEASSNLSATPQFNSAAWQNANFYNNPLSFYQQNQTNVTSPPQQIHIMQDFSAAPPTRPHIQNPLSNSFAYATQTHTNQFQVGGAKVAPSISLIPDLGFVAPATSTHTAFVNVLPHPSFANKK